MSMSVEFPDELLEGRLIETTIFSPENEDIGIAILSEFQGGTYVMRIYQLEQSQHEKYSPIQELAAFSFHSRRKFDEFLESLPEMSGLEMLLALNPSPGVGH